MWRKILFILFIFVFSKATAQSKLPIYIFQFDNNYYRGFCGVDKSWESYKTIVFQIFEDSTFTLTINKSISSFFPKERRATLRGRYAQHGDTLFLNDSISKAYPRVEHIFP